MAGHSELITTAELADILTRPELRLFDCTTYLEPAPAGSGVPYIVVSGRQTFEAGHIPGANFLDLQAEFSDPRTELRFMMPPTATLPTMTCVVWCRGAGPATSSCGKISGLFMASRISGFGDIHQGGDGPRVRRAKR